MRVTVGLPLLPSTPSFLPLIFFPQLGHDSSNSRNWSCNNLLSGIHRRSSPDQSVITLFLVLPSLPSPGYLRDHRTRNPLLLSLSLPLSLSPFSHVENLTSVSKEEVVDVAQNVENIERGDAEGSLRSFARNEGKNSLFEFFFFPLVALLRWIALFSLFFSFSSKRPILINFLGGVLFPRLPDTGVASRRGMTQFIAR